VHESTKNNREALYTFFQKHLGLPGDSEDVETTPFSVEELWVTPTGQVGTSFDCEPVFSLNRNYFQGKKVQETGLPEKVAQTAGIEFKRKLTAAVYTGTFTKNNIRVEKYFLENNLKDFALPVYLIKNETNNTEKPVVWFHPEGKQKLLDEPLLSVLLQGGHTVICADLPGTGELYDPEFTGDGVIQGIPFNYTFGANLAGKSIPGIQAEAIDLLMQFTGNRFSDKPTEAMVQGIAASAALYYAVLKNPFSKMTFRNFPEPVEKLITREYYNPAVAFTAAPGSLNVYDLPDLVEYLNNAGTEIITKSADK